MNIEKAAKAILNCTSYFIDNDDNIIITDDHVDILYIVHDEEVKALKDAGYNVKRIKDTHKTMYGVRIKERK